MNKIQRLENDLQHVKPEPKTSLSRPKAVDGIWFLDVELNNKHVIVEWTEDRGFGITTPSDHDFAEHADENYGSLANARRRVIQLLQSNTQTSPPIGILLARLREKRGLTQKALAERLGVKQATISGAESRGDIQLSTLRRLIEALGGTLEISCLFPEMRVSIEPTHRNANPGTDTTFEIPLVPYEELFPRLRETGGISNATNKANEIKERQSVLEMVE